MYYATEKSLRRVSDYKDKHFSGQTLFPPSKQHPINAQHTENRAWKVSKANGSSRIQSPWGMIRGEGIARLALLYP